MPVIVTACLAAGPACTSLQPTEATPDDIRQMILTEGLLAPGQRVRIVTGDEREHEFKVTAIDTERALVLGKDESIAIDEIVAVESSEFSIGKTALLTGGLTYGIALIIAIAIAPALILGGG